MWHSIISLFQDYMGSGLVLIWYLISLVWLLLREEDRTRRCLLVYTPLIILVVFFNPPVMKLMDRLADSEIYYRLLWLLPVSATILYSLIRIGEGLKAPLRGLFLGGAFALMIFSGKLIYLDAAFGRAENVYHVPDCVVEICDEIAIPGRDVMAVFPNELVSYVRQYSSYVCMPYGRDATVSTWGVRTNLYYAMNREVIDGEELGRLAAEAGCHYVILPADREITGQLTDYELWDEVGDYVLYRSLSANFTLVFD